MVDPVNLTSTKADTLKTSLPNMGWVGRALKTSQTVQFWHRLQVIFEVKGIFPTWYGLDEYCKLLKPCSSSHPFLAPGQSTNSHLYQSLKAAKIKLPKSFIEIVTFRCHWESHF